MTNATFRYTLRRCGGRVAPAACTSSPSATPAAALPDSLSGASSAPSSGEPAASSSSAASSSAAPVSRAVISSTPADSATGASVLEPVVVQVANGTLGTVVMTNPEGAEVTGTLSADGTSWTSGEVLGYGRTYQIDGDRQRFRRARHRTSTSSFTTVTPAGVIFPSFEPPPDRGKVGVGQPISVIFDKPAPRTRPPPNAPSP